ncbi:hypothetical protein [Streptomyces sp. NBRC 109706]|uniref:hypothetical protein n=1 Tax=Streptomyces sp. NBRC 109706 TaxID=1550035 RepID=UPI0007861294|nr:hypothetical protein [Streptomyces sp. NBRC 109706]
MSQGKTGLRGRKGARGALVATALAATAVLAGSPAYAATNDSFSAWTTGGGCGMLEFVDYGPGAPGGGDNDDYLVIHDYCADGYGVRAYAWLNGYYLGTKYNGNGLAGSAVVWDPYKPYGNVYPGDYVDIEVCLVNGSNGSPVKCGAAQRTSVDG